MKKEIKPFDIIFHLIILLSHHISSLKKIKEKSNIFLTQITSLRVKITELRTTPFCFIQLFPFF